MKVKAPERNVLKKIEPNSVKLARKAVLLLLIS